MMSSQKFRVYFFIFLAFCVASSKNLLIYNEETLVALSFFLFVFFVAHYFGNTITESLNERSQLIHQEFEKFLNIQHQSFQELLAEHQKLSHLHGGVASLAKFTTTQLTALNSTTQKALLASFRDQIHSKLKTLAFSKIMLQHHLQGLFSDTLLANVLVASRHSQAQGKSSALLKNTLKKALDLVIPAGK